MNYIRVYIVASCIILEFFRCIRCVRPVCQYLWIFHLRILSASAWLNLWSMQINLFGGPRTASGIARPPGMLYTELQQVRQLRICVTKTEFCSNTFIRKQLPYQVCGPIRSENWTTWRNDIVGWSQADIKNKQTARLRSLLATVQLELRAPAPEIVTHPI